MIPNTFHKEAAYNRLAEGCQDARVIDAAVEIVLAWIDRRQIEIKYFQIILN